jgi:hypothetical protein
LCFESFSQLFSALPFIYPFFQASLPIVRNPSLPTKIENILIVITLVSTWMPDIGEHNLKKWLNKWEQLRKVEKKIQKSIFSFIFLPKLKSHYYAKSLYRSWAGVFIRARQN